MQIFFAFTSLGDSLASVLAEAMACKCPCIASNSGSNSELVGLKELLTEPQNPKAMADGIIYLLENPSHAEEISTFLHSRVKQLFSRDVMARQYYEFISRYTKVSNDRKVKLDLFDCRRGKTETFNFI